MSWECATAGHAHCSTGGCRCSCHYRLGQADGFKRDTVSTDIAKLPNPPSDIATTVEPNTNGAKKCPKCGAVAARAEDKFCRRDGTAFPPDAAHCGGCGLQAAPGDLYCAGCGGPLTAEVATVSPQGKRKRSDPS